MSDKYMTLEDLYEEQAFGTKSTPPAFDSHEEASPHLNSLGTIPKSEILRIEEKVYVSWGGVTGCCAQDRIDGSCRAKLEEWAKNKMFEHRQLRWLRYGSLSAQVSCSQSRAPWPDNSRSCRGSVSLPCYIEFTK